MHIRHAESDHMPLPIIATSNEHKMEARKKRDDRWTKLLQGYVFGRQSSPALKNALSSSPAPEDSVGMGSIRFCRQSRPALICTQIVTRASSLWASLPEPKIWGKKTSDMSCKSSPVIGHVSAMARGDHLE